MGHIEVAHVDYYLPDGRTLLDDVSFRIGDGAKAALIGPNGAGKTTLLRLIAGDEDPHAGTVTTSGGLGVMRQFIGSVRDATPVRAFLGGLAPAGVRRAVERLTEAEAHLAGGAEAEHVAYAEAITAFGDAGGYELEVLWDTCCRAAVGVAFDELAARPVATLSGGEQKRLALEVLLRGEEEVLLLDEPDNMLDVPSKRWLEREIAATRKTILFVSHDRELIANAARQIVTVEARSAWVHGSGMATYDDAREARIERFEELRRRWDEKREQLRQLVLRLRDAATVSDANAGAYRAAVTRLRRFEEAGPPPTPPRPQRLSMRLGGGRTGVRAITCERLELTGLTRPLDLEVFYGERLAVLGPNGTGKSHFLRLLAGEEIDHAGEARLGARVVPGYFAQTHERPDLAGRTARAAVEARGLDRNRAMSSLTRYGLTAQAEQRFETLSGGQQARLQILLLETSGATLLVLDEPTDNLDLESAEALEAALDAFDGTVVAVTHDRWFARRFDRFVAFRADGAVRETDGPVWD